jgi:hypothetical protein
MTYPGCDPKTGIDARSYIVKLAEHLESVHQVSLLSRRGLEIVGINTNGTKAVVEGGSHKGSGCAVFPEFTSGGNTAGMSFHARRNGVGEGNRYRRLLEIKGCGKNGSQLGILVFFGHVLVSNPDLAFVLAFDVEAEIGDEGDDGLLGYLVGIEADRHFAFGIGRLAGSDALLLAEHGVEAGSAGDTTEPLDEISYSLVRFSRQAFEGSQAANARHGH